MAIQNSGVCRVFSPSGAAPPATIAARRGDGAKAPARLIRVLADAIGLPPTADKLASLRVKDLKTAAQGDLEDLDLDALKTALALLKG
ncbi:MAG TPA: dinitrogenase iron-molybdenum cofactor N-terminal domain-containing protein, partial [Kofleriaceae bacterium]|nr:dinitrogenase iron-molybdenum cofactor N-terminal domain-containing protein [Kofleriaceae bacterium]